MFFVTLACLQRTHRQQKAQHKIVYLSYSSIRFGEASFPSFDLIHLFYFIYYFLFNDYWAC